MDCKTKRFIEKAQQIHNYTYDYTEVSYENARTPVVIICKLHGKFLQTPSCHLMKRGCKPCGIERHKLMIRKKYGGKFIEKAIKKHGDKYDYSKVIYNNSKINVIIICKKHGEFLQTPNNHLSGSDCRLCGIIRGKNIRTSTTEEFIKKSKIVHNDKYLYTKTNYILNREKVIIICRKHGEFLQIPNDHLAGKECKLCSIIKGAKSRTSSTEKFIKKSIKVHGDRYIYNKTNYVNSKNRVIIICKKHGEFLQKPSHHLMGCNCPKCAQFSYSKTAINWLQYLSYINNIHIQHYENDGEHIIKNSKYSADGYCEETNTIYEFHGCFWHGCPKCYKPDDINKVTKSYFKELYDKTIEREKFIQTQGYNLITIWEHEWKEMREKINDIGYDISLGKRVNNTKIINWLWEIMSCEDGKLDIHKNDEYVFRWSCGNGYLDMARYLWNECVNSENKIDIHILRNEAFRMSCYNGYIDVAKWLWTLSCENKNKIDIHSYNDFVIRHGNKEVKDWLNTLMM